MKEQTTDNMNEALCGGQWTSVFYFVLLLLPYCSGAVTLEDCEEALTDNSIQKQLFNSLIVRQQAGDTNVCQQQPMAISLEYYAEQIDFKIYPVNASPGPEPQDGSPRQIRIGVRRAAETAGCNRNCLIYFITDPEKNVYLNGISGNSIIAMCEFGEVLLDQVVPVWKHSSPPAFP